MGEVNLSVPVAHGMYDDACVIYAEKTVAAA